MEFRNLVTGNQEEAVQLIEEIFAEEEAQSVCVLALQSTEADGVVLAEMTSDFHPVAVRLARAALGSVTVEGGNEILASEILFQLGDPMSAIHLDGPKRTKVDCKSDVRSDLKLAVGNRREQAVLDVGAATHIDAAYSEEVESLNGNRDRRDRREGRSLAVADSGLQRVALSELCLVRAFELPGL